MRFAHMADCHLGAWNNHPELRELPIKTFETALDLCINDEVDFILIAGDLFDTSFPPIDILRRAVSKIRQCRDHGIAVYAIPGSHDFSPTGKTFLNVLDDAGLIRNVAKDKPTFVIDKKTMTKIIGIAGRPGSLDKNSFQSLDKSIEREHGFKVFMFHCGIENYHNMGIPLSLLPKNFDYYAGGHIHKTLDKDESGYGRIAFPGPLFPTDFDELVGEYGFYIVNASNNRIMTQRKRMKICDVCSIKVDANSKSAGMIENEIIKGLDNELSEKILLLKIEGVMDGKPSDIDFRKIYSLAKSRGAFAIKRNTSKLAAKELEEVAVRRDIVIEELEKEIIKEHAGKVKISAENESALTLGLMKVLEEERQEGENVSSYEERIIGAAKKVLNL